MKNILVGLILLLTAFLAGCGGEDSGGGASDPNGAAIVQLTAAKTMALADGSDAVTLLAEVTRADGAAVADGTLVTFTVSAGSGNLSAAVVATNGGAASVDLTRSPIDGAKNQVVTVTGSTGRASASTAVKFINQPTSVDLFIATEAPVANLGGLTLTVNNTAGASFNNATAPVFTLNNAAVGASLAAASFSAAANSTRIGLINANGINTGTAPILRATFAVASGLPSFSVDQTANLTAVDPSGAALTPPLTAANLVLTTTFDTEL